jgi:hypothetical protein
VDKGAKIEPTSMEINPRDNKIYFGGNGIKAVTYVEN